MKRRIFRYIYSWLETFNYLFSSCLHYLPSRTLRKILLKLAGAKISRSVSIFSSVSFRCPSKLIIGEGSSIGPKVLLDARKGLKIGKSVTIAYEAIIWTLHHDMNSKTFATTGNQVIINDYAWICSRSIILPGVIIGKGAVVASGSVVTKDVPEFTVVGGVPAKPIGIRAEKDLDYSPYYNLHII